MKAQETIELEQQYVVQTYKRPPFVIEKGDGVYLYDAQGRKYLDFAAGIAVNALGYNDPQVMAAIEEQGRKLIHVSNLYHTAPHAKLAKMLVENSFADRVFFCNSGTEAVEAGLKFARKWAGAKFSPQKHQFVAFTHSFHGRTFGSLALTYKEKYRKPFEPLMPGARFAEFNDIASAKDTIDEDVCACIVEPVQGEGGINPAEKGFLVALQEICEENHALLIFDEIQCGLGRTGYLWAHRYYGVEPDIMTLAKPLGGGLPIGAALVTEEIASAIEAGDHGSTFAANPLICAVAQVVFQRIKDEGFLASVRKKGTYLEAKLNELQDRHESIVEVRGRGLMWGLQTGLEASQVVSAGYQEGLIVTTAGEHVVRLLPPLVVEKEHIDLALGMLDTAFRKAEDGRHDPQG